MAEYIEREKAIQVVLDACNECLDTCAEFDGIVPDCNQCMLDGVHRRLRATPAADVRPVVKARWVYTDMSRLVCSNCGSPVAFALKADGWHHGDYCPNCGADMRPEPPKEET